MRVLNILMAKGRGGIEAMAVRYHEALKGLGHDVLSLGHANGPLKDLKDFRAFSCLGTYDLFAALRLRRIADEFGADVVFTHGNRATGLGLMGLSGCRDRLIPVVHNFRFKSHIACAKRVIAVSSAVKEDLAKTYPHKTCHLIENFARLDFLDVKNVQNPEPIVGLMGRLHVNKGFDIAILALGHLKREGVSFHLKIAGEGGERAALEALVAAQDLADRTEFLGWVMNPSAFLGSLDLFLVPSRVEPFGLVVVEAMAAGVPVIASDIDGPAVILKPKDDAALGILVAPNDDHALALAIKSALNAPLETKNMAMRAHIAAGALYRFERGQALLGAMLEHDFERHQN